MQNIIRFFFIFIIAFNLEASSHNFDFIFLRASYGYNEYNTNGNLLDTESSSFLDTGGYELSYMYKIKTRSRFDLGFKILYKSISGKTDYVGSELGSDEPYGSIKSTTDNEYKTKRIFFNLDYNFSNSIVLASALGYGNYEWVRELSQIQVETYSWDEFLIKLGLEYKVSLWKFGVDFYYMNAIEPRMKTSNLNGTFYLGKTDSQTFSFYGEYSVLRNLNLLFGYDMTKQNINCSDPLIEDGQVYYEPKSEDNQDYLKIGFRYRF